MKTTGKLTLALLTLGSAASMLLAQDGPPQDGERPHGPRPGMGGPGQGGHRPPPPVIAALDANHDGVIDATEIANASSALAKLDKNGDGQLTPDELRPPRPQGRPPGGPQGNRPEGEPPQDNQ